jgi:ABC transporter DrrB family efflux protein
VNGLGAILLKELAHIRRQPSTLFFAFLIPVLQMTIFGYAINLTIEDIPTIVLDLDGKQESRQVVDAFVNSQRFAIIERAADRETFDHAITAGRAQVGIIIPPDYAAKLLRGESAAIQVLIDGSDSQVATTALNGSALLGWSMSMGKARKFGDSMQLAVARGPGGEPRMPIEIRPRLLYNPNLESAHFFVPALIGIIMQLVTLFLTAFAIVRERELGTLEQLFVTPVGRAALLLGKLIPYAVIGFAETLLALLVMVVVFKVPIAGSLLLLLGLSLLFLVTSLALGLLVSTVAKTQVQALQFAFIIMMPSILLSGFMFPRESMPTPIYWITFLIPVSYFLQILRGIVLRAADFSDLWPHAVGLACCCLVILSVSLLRFRKQIS